MGCKISTEKTKMPKKKLSQVDQLPQSHQKQVSPQKSKEITSQTHREPKQSNFQEEVIMKANISSRKNLQIISNEKSTQTDNNYLEVYFQARLRKEKEMIETVFKNLEGKDKIQNLSIHEKTQKINDSLHLPQIQTRGGKNPRMNYENFTSSRDISKISVKKKKSKKPIKVYKSMLALLSPEDCKRKEVTSKQSLIVNSGLKAEREIPVKEEDDRLENSLKIPNDTSAIDLRNRSRTSIAKNEKIIIDEKKPVEENRFKIFRAQKSRKSFKGSKKKKKLINFMSNAKISRVLSSSSSSSSNYSQVKHFSSLSEREVKNAQYDGSPVKKEKNYQFPPKPKNENGKNLHKSHNFTPSSYQSKLMNKRLGQSLHYKRLDSMKTYKEDKDYSINTVSIKGRRGKKPKNSNFHEIGSNLGDPCSPSKFSYRNSKNEAISPLLKKQDEAQAILRLNNNIKKVRRKTSSQFYSKRGDIIKSNKLFGLRHRGGKPRSKTNHMNLGVPLSEAGGISPRKRYFSNIPEEDEKDHSVSQQQQKDATSKKQKKTEKSMQNIKLQTKSRQNLLSKKSDKPRISIISPDDNKNRVESPLRNEFKDLKNLSREEMLKLRSKLYRKKKTIVKNTPEIIVSERLQRRRQSQMIEVKNKNFQRQMSMQPLVGNRNSLMVRQERNEMEDSDFFQD